MPITRREFCAITGAAGLSVLTRTTEAAQQKEQTLRVIAYNVYACKGWPSNRTSAVQAVKRKQMAQRLAMELALYDPDLINFSESPTEDIAKEVAKLLRMHHVRFPSGGNWPGTLLCKTEISEAVNVPLGTPRPEALFTRHWGRGTIKLPSGDSLIVHSAHLYPTRDPVVRLQEIRAMLKAMKPDLDAGRSMLLIGDLNHNPDTEEHKLWTAAGWIDTFHSVGQGKGLTIPADDPKYRIDYVMATGPIARQLTESKPLFEGAFRLNVADPTSFALSDHLPQMAVFDLNK